MNRKIDKKRIFIVLSIILITLSFFVYILGFPNTDKGGLRPKDGILDLENWSPDNGILSLAGGWNFYWNSFLTYQNITKDNPGLDVKANIPEVWNKYKMNGKNLPGFGYGTYTIKVVNASVGKPLALKIPILATAYQLYIDDNLISSSGKAGRDKEHFSPGYKPQVAEFTPAKESFEIIVHVANFVYAQGGMCYPISMGTPGQIQSMERSTDDKDLILFGALIIMAFYYINIFLLRREDKSSLYFALICVILATTTAISGDYLIYRLIPGISFKEIIAVYYIILCWFPVCAAFIIEALFPEDNSRKVLRAAFVYAIIMSLIILLTPVSFYSGLVYVIDAAGILIGVYCIITLTISFLRERKDALIVFLGAYIAGTCAVYDMLFQSSTTKLASLVMLIVQPFVLAKRFSEAYKNVSYMSQKLLKLDKLKDEFLSNTSHELRTPLNGILGITDAMIKGSDGQLNQRQKQDLSLIASSSRRLANLVNDILDYSKLKVGDLKLDIRPIRIEGLIYTVVNVLRQLNTEKDYEILSDISGELPYVMADENRVIQVLYNLLGNAIKFTTNGYIKVTARKAGKMLEICVSDTGEGIPAGKLEDIFKSFEQVDTSLTRAHGGTGLGLPITKHLIELQGGSIWVESYPGKGSKFYFTLPLAENVPVVNEQAASVSELTAASAEEIPSDAETSAEGIRILLVDDDAVNLKAEAAVLKLGGYSVKVANSGKAALGELEKNTGYALVILDVMMPEMSGYEVCRKFRDIKPAFDLPVLMLTAKASTQDIVLGFEAGANDYLPKPFEPEELLARVRTLVNLKLSVDKAMAAEVAFLQAQIKPHFLFNTLNTISSFCDSDPARAQVLIDEFSNYLRHCFDFKSLESFGSLENELNLVRSYVEIQKARFGEQLQVVFDIEGRVNARLPLLSIQPLVENAVNHGLRKKGGKGIITISVRKFSGEVQISVKDDGQGIEPEKLEHLLEEESGRGIGLWNINRRLKGIYGKGLIIESSPGKGIKVTFSIPQGGDLN
ncbi:MAG: ATP-binding protein [Bacillota bacterium]|nr:ATP-binding protein [Bacillota bacterium]